MTVELPKLDYANSRAREYKNTSSTDVAEIVYRWLFEGAKTREMDRDVLGLDPEKTKGYHSMGVLHFLGLKRPFQGFFRDQHISDALSRMEKNQQNFSKIVLLLEGRQAPLSESDIKKLTTSAKKRAEDFADTYGKRLAELDSTDTGYRSAKFRKEQATLRTILFGGKDTAQCALCHQQFPTKLLVAAHIKPRARCSSLERTDPNIVMPACKTGCDDFFEHGFLIVDGDGVIQVNKAARATTDLTRMLTDRGGLRCTHHNPHTAGYFKYRRDLNT